MVLDMYYFYYNMRLLRKGMNVALDGDGMIDAWIEKGKGGKGSP